MRILKFFVAVCLSLTQPVVAQNAAPTANDSGEVVLYKLDPVVEVLVDSLGKPLTAAILAEANGDTYLNRQMLFGQFETSLRELIRLKPEAEVNAILDLALAQVILSEAGSLMIQDENFRLSMEKKIQKRIAKASNGSKWKRIRNGAIVGAAVGFVAILGVVNAQSRYTKAAHLSTGKDFMQIFLSFAAIGGLVGYGVHGVVSLVKDDIATVDLLKQIQSDPELRLALSAMISEQK